ncbi:allantoicase [Alkalilimnicola ehrlichii]|uniref:Probable allantoicase n=1 Tax=Alkalilimnicola ehrlichii TaxID=351052 RepID=A0A3E0X182_9GAMM|nr:allantoicase [Alkalilimnicola ehrlichii]RFA24476.1 allantoicase [Alkalilimnicola ehrlichii]RFA38486.1 allantoicase [Alkalilimnicola ehrlichii]
MNHPDFEALSNRWPNLASARLGARVVEVTDEFFAPAERMLADSEPVFIPGKYDDHGKWMDGWESRRRRGPGHDWAVVALAVPGAVAALEIDTRHFTGNYPLAAEVEFCRVDSDTELSTAAWQTLTPLTSLQGDHCHRIEIDTPQVCSHLRLHIHPDGGIARFRVYGTPSVDWAQWQGQTNIELSAAQTGGRILAFSDAHFGRPDPLLYPGRGRDMGDGWETRRRREPGFDWCVIALGHPGTIHRLEVDTAHYKGNYPAQASVEAACLPGVTDPALLRTSSMFWQPLLPASPVGPDSIHIFEKELTRRGPFTHVRLNIHPDGGISRFRVFGEPVQL